MNQITQKQYVSLVDKIYSTLMEGEDMGMGEMGDARDEAIKIVEAWMQENGITFKENVPAAAANTMKKGTVIEWQKWPYKVVKTFGDLVHLRPCNYYSGRVRMHSGTTTLKLVNGELTEYNPFLKP